MTKKACLLLAEGFEEIEAVTLIDVLRRAGVEVKTAGLSGKTVRGAHDIVMESDIRIGDCRELPDALILPGGMPGAAHLGDSAAVMDLVKKTASGNKIVAAICAAPALVLGPSGVLDGKKATCYPGFETEFPASVKYTAARVTVDGNIITGSGPGSALEFALELVRLIAGADKAAALKQGMLAKS